MIMFKTDKGVYYDYEGFLVFPFIWMRTGFVSFYALFQQTV